MYVGSQGMLVVEQAVLTIWNVPHVYACVFEYLLVPSDFEKVPLLENGYW